MLLKYPIYNQPLRNIREGKTLITTLNAHCYNVALNDPLYQKALFNSDILIPDGISVILSLKWLTGERLEKIAGSDLFYYEMKRLQLSGGKCFFLGSTDNTLQKIKERAAREFPNIKVKAYSPPYKAHFEIHDNNRMLKAINDFKPDVLFIGMTAPKQEKWAYQHYDELQVGHICCIGAVFDFYAGTVKRAPQWMIKLGLEWLYRLIKEPRRMWRRYLIGNTKFLYYISKEKIAILHSTSIKPRIIHIKEGLEYWGKFPRLTAWLLGPPSTPEVQLPEELLPDHLRKPSSIPAGQSTSFIKKTNEKIMEDQDALNVG